MSDIPRSAQADSPSAHAPINSPAERKKSARLALRAARRSRSASEREERARALTEHGLSAEFLQTATVVASFIPLATEPDVAVLNHALLERGINVIVPVMLPDKDLTWRPLLKDDDLGKNAIARADVILTPALALGRGGERLGQGGGSYDRALTRRSGEALIVGVVFAEELDQVFPSETHDQAVHMSLTENGLRSYEAPISGTFLRE